MNHRPNSARIRTLTILLCLTAWFAPLAAPITAQEQPGGIVVNGDLGKRLSEAVARAGGEDFWGSVLVVRKGDVLLAQAYGLADYEKTPNTPDTLFEIASTSKQFTAAGILKLQQQGKLRVEDTLDKFFRGVPEDKKSITLHHLLTHTSGMSPDLGLPYASTATRDEFIRFVLAPPLVSEPGKEFAYFNSGYAILAAVIEVASGKSFEAYMHKEVFQPAGLHETGFIRDKSLHGKPTTKRLSEGTGPGDTAVRWHWGWGYRGMGGVVTTVHDLLRWDRALRGDAVLNAEARRTLYEPHLQGYACGWMIEQTPRGATKAFHSGGVAGFVAQFVRYLEEDVVIAILSNGRSNLGAVQAAIEGLLFEQPEIRAVLDFGPYTLGEYKSVMLDRRTLWEVRRVGETLRLTLEDPDAKHVVAVIDLPRTYARKLLSELESAARTQTSSETDSEPEMEIGIYAIPYGIAGKKLRFEEGMEVFIMPRYTGVDAEGNEIVDERATFVLADRQVRQWPLMVKMNPTAARALRRAIEKEAP